MTGWAGRAQRAHRNMLESLVLFAIFGVFPLGFSLYLGFMSWEPTSGLDAMRYVGLENFAFALEDAWFWKAMKKNRNRKKGTNGRPSSLPITL